MLRSEVTQARGRVAQLRKELRQARAEVACARRGVDTLAEVEQKLSAQQGCYNITEAQAIMTELKNIQKSLTSGEKERADLMQSLAKLKDDLTRLQLGDASPDLSTLTLPQEKLSTASQTDLCADLVPIGTRLAEMARVRLQYDEARKRIQQIQQQLADLEDKVQPGQAESDKDRLLLFQEKEQLLRELRSITPRTRSKQEMTDIQIECKKLEQDLKNAFEMSNKCIADRLRLHEEKQLLLQQLKDALTSMTTLEGQLKTLSASTLSVSSSSSLGSLSTASSKGSLSSGISFTDIYGGPQIAASFQADKPIDMVDLHRRVERLLRGSSFNADSATPGASSSPSQPSLSPRIQLQGPGRPCEPLSPISETPPPPLSPRTPSSSGTNTRSVSAAVSDESVAGDSGVFEAAQAGNDPTNAVVNLILGCAQVSLADFEPDTVTQKWYNVLSFRCMRRDESSDESTVISSQTSTLTRNRGEWEMIVTHEVQRFVEEDSFEEYIPEEDIALEEEYLHPTTAEKETNTECNFCPEGARQLHRRLNRSESDSSMAQYARRGLLKPPPPMGIPFDRSLRERRSLREKMAFFTRSKPTIPVLPSEEGEDIPSEDEWEGDFEERRTPDGRSSKTSYELRNHHPAETSEISEPSLATAHVVECKNPCIAVTVERSECNVSEAKPDDNKTEEV
ncbi:putative WW, C2 and coiled-coil domain containing 1, partial [Operophtera brumata]